MSEVVWTKKIGCISHEDTKVHKALMDFFCETLSLCDLVARIVSYVEKSLGVMRAMLKMRKIEIQKLRMFRMENYLSGTYL